MRRLPPIARLLALACLLSLLTGAMPASAATARDSKTRQLQEKRREVAEKKAAAAAEVDVLRASDERLEQALATLNREVGAQEASVASARQAAAVAAAESTKLKTDQEQTRAQIAALRTKMKDVAVTAYIRGPGDGIGIAFGAKDLQEATQRRQMVDVVNDRQTDVADELRALEEDLGVQRAAAEVAADKAAARKKAVERKLGDLKTSLASQQRVAADIEDRLEARLGEADALAALDADVAGQIKARQAELARLVAARPPAARASRSATRISGAPGGLATIRGITVAASLAPNLAAMLDAADAAGLSFSGGGYRDPAGQVATRRANCGSSNYDIYEKPPSQCRPQTARPGTSMHERGLAIDFQHNGALITSRSNPGFRWLAANAGRFGLSNLPEEPWHWSTTGR